MQDAHYALNTILATFQFYTDDGELGQAEDLKEKIQELLSAGLTERNVGKIGALSLLWLSKYVTRGAK